MVDRIRLIENEDTDTPRNLSKKVKISETAVPQ